MAGLPAITCPGCGFCAPIEVFAGDKDARFAFALMGKVPPVLSDALLRYLSLFAPAKHKLTWTRMRALLVPVVEAIEAGRINRAKRDWTVTLAQWEAGLQQMAERRAQLSLPLKSHGYLWEVLAGAANQIEARAEAAGIEAARKGTGAARQGNGEARSEASEWDEDRRRQQERSRALSAATVELQSCRRLKLPMPTAEQLAKTLTGQGINAEAASFVAGKVLADQAAKDAKL